MSDPARTAAERVRAESEVDSAAAKKYLRAARTNEPELAAAVKSEETARVCSRWRSGARRDTCRAAC